ncbi:hypothetical protein BG004_003804, partial [Podila humilis]
MADIEGKRKPLPGKIQPVSVEAPPDAWEHLHEYFGSDSMPSITSIKKVSRLQQHLAESTSRPGAFAFASSRSSSSKTLSSTVKETRTATTTTAPPPQSSAPPSLFDSAPSLPLPEKTNGSFVEGSSRSTQANQGSSLEDKEATPGSRPPSRLARQFEITGKRLLPGQPETLSQGSHDASLNQPPYGISTGKENILPKSIFTTRMKTAYRPRQKQQFVRPRKLAWGQPVRGLEYEPDNQEDEDLGARKPIDNSSFLSDSSPDEPAESARILPKTPSPSSGSGPNSQSPDLTIEDLHVHDQVPAVPAPPPARPYRSRLDGMRERNEAPPAPKKPRHEKYDSGSEVVVVPAEPINHEQPLLSKEDLKKHIVEDKRRMAENKQHKAEEIRQTQDDPQYKVDSSRHIEETRRHKDEDKKHERGDKETLSSSNIPVANSNHLHQSPYDEQQTQPRPAWGTELTPTTAAVVPVAVVSPTPIPKHDQASPPVSHHSQQPTKGAPTKPSRPTQSEGISAIAQNLAVGSTKAAHWNKSGDGGSGSSS